MKPWTAIVVLLLVASAASAQDVVTYRERGLIQTAKGKVESETLAGVRISGRTIPINDIVDIQYETPGSIKLDLPKAVKAEAAGQWDDAIKEYRSLMTVPSVANNRLLKKHFDFKVAMLLAGKSTVGSQGPREAIEALTKFIQAYPDGWERLAVARLLGQLHLDSTPPDFDSARKVFEDLARASGLPEDLKLDCALTVVDLLNDQKKSNDARQALARLPAGDPRVEIYRIVAATDSNNLNTTIKKLEELLDKSEPRLKATIYNALGDCYHMDPKRHKDALFAYLWVDVVYNQDARETIRAQERLSHLFRESKEEERAQLYHNKARGRH